LTTNSNTKKGERGLNINTKTIEEVADKFEGVGERMALVNARNFTKGFEPTVQGN
jgi:hypothetical protein